jgi:hypothetical protein
MGKVKKMVLGLTIIIAVAFIAVSVFGWNPEIKPVTLNLSEKAAIQKVTFDSSNNALLLDMQSVDTKTIVFNVAIIEDANHKTVATIVPFQAELPANKNTTITINLNDTNLAPGNYTVNLRTVNTYHFYSPLFAVQ